MPERLHNERIRNAEELDELDQEIRPRVEREIHLTLDEAKAIIKSLFEEGNISLIPGERRTAQRNMAIKRRLIISLLDAYPVTVASNKQLFQEAYDSIITDYTTEVNSEGYVSLVARRPATEAPERNSAEEQRVIQAENEFMERETEIENQIKGKILVALNDIEFPEAGLTYQALKQIVLSANSQYTESQFASAVTSLASDREIQEGRIGRGTNAQITYRIPSESEPAQTQTQGIFFVDVRDTSIPYEDLNEQAREQRTQYIMEAVHQHPENLRLWQRDNPQFLPPVNRLTAGEVVHNESRSRARRGAETRRINRGELRLVTREEIRSAIETRLSEHPYTREGGGLNLLGMYNTVLQKVFNREPTTDEASVLRQLGDENTENIGNTIGLMLSEGILTDNEQEGSTLYRLARVPTAETHTESTRIQNNASREPVTATSEQSRNISSLSNERAKEIVLDILNVNQSVGIKTRELLQIIGGRGGNYHFTGEAAQNLRNGRPRWEKRIQWTLTTLKNEHMIKKTGNKWYLTDAGINNLVEHGQRGHIVATETVVRPATVGEIRGEVPREVREARTGTRRAIANTPPTTTTTTRPTLTPKERKIRYTILNGADSFTGYDTTRLRGYLRYEPSIGTVSRSELSSALADLVQAGLLTESTSHRRKVYMRTAAGNNLVTLYRENRINTFIDESERYSTFEAIPDTSTIFIHSPDARREGSRNNDIMEFTLPTGFTLPDTPVRYDNLMHKIEWTPREGQYFFNPQKGKAYKFIRRLSTSQPENIQGVSYPSGTATVEDVATHEEGIADYSRVLNSIPVKKVE